MFEPSNKRQSDDNCNFVIILFVLKINCRNVLYLFYFFVFYMIKIRFNIKYMICYDVELRTAASRWRTTNNYYTTRLPGDEHEWDGVLQNEIGRSGHAQKTQLHTHSRGDGGDERDLMHSTKRAAARVVLVVTPSISAANFVHIQPSKVDVHNNDNNYTYTYAPSQPALGSSKLLLYWYKCVYNYTRHSGTTLEEVEGVAGKNNPLARRETVI